MPYICIYITCRISIPSSPSNIIELPTPAIVKIDLFLQVLIYEGHSNNKIKFCLKTKLSVFIKIYYHAHTHTHTHKRTMYEFLSIFSEHCNKPISRLFFVVNFYCQNNRLQNSFIDNWYSNLYLIPPFLQIKNYTHMYVITNTALYILTYMYMLIQNHP